MKLKALFAFLVMSSLPLAGTNAKTAYLDGPEDLHGKTVCVQTGATPDIYFSDVFKDVEIRRVEQATDVPLMVASGKADVGAVSSLIWLTQQYEYPELSCFPLGACNTDIAIALPKESTQLAAELNDFLDRFIKTEEFSEIKAGWSRNPENRQMPVPDPEVCNQGILKIALSPDQPPFDMIINGAVAGIEPEMLSRFAMEKHMQVQFVQVNFAGIIPTLVSGKADIGCTIMSITEERSQSVLFSNAWTKEEVEMVVRKEHMSKYADSLSVSNESLTKTGLWQRAKTGFEKNVIREQRYKLLWQGTLMTIIISLLSALIGTLFGIILSMGSLSSHKFFYKASDLYIGFMRSMPQVVLLMIMFYIVFGKSDISGPAVAVIAFSMCFGAYTSVIFTSTYNSIDKGQREASLAMGFTPVQSFFNFILPQVMQRALPVYKNEFISLVKATSIVGYIAVFDLTRAGDVIRSRTFEAFFPLIIVTVIYFLIIWLLTQLLKIAEVKSQPVVHKYSKKD